MKNKLQVTVAALLLPLRFARLTQRRGAIENVPA